MRPPYEPEAPEEWVKKSRHEIDRLYTSAAQEVRERLGLKKPCKVSQVERVVTTALADERSIGETVWLRFPRKGGGVGEECFREGVEPARPLTRSHPEPDGATAYLEAERHPLALLAETAHGMVARTRCKEEQAVAYLLAGEPFTLPWLTITTEAGPLGPRFLVDIGTSDVTGTYLRDAYSEAARRALGLAPTGRRRRQRAESLELITFVEDRRAAGMTWAAITTEWNEGPHETVFPDFRKLRNRYTDSKSRHDAQTEGVDR